MKNELFNYLKKYVPKCNSYFNFVSNLQTIGKITLDEEDKLISDICEFSEYILYKACECPYLELHIKSIIKNKPGRKHSNKNSNKDFSSTYAIGFVADEDEPLIDEDTIVM